MPAPHRVYQVDTGSSKVQDAKSQRPGHDDQQAGQDDHGRRGSPDRLAQVQRTPQRVSTTFRLSLRDLPNGATRRSEEHTSELQSQSNLVCRLLLEKKKKKRK